MPLYDITIRVTVRENELEDAHVAADSLMEDLEGSVVDIVEVGLEREKTNDT